MPSSYIPYQVKDLTPCKTRHLKNDSYLCPRCSKPLSPDGKGNRLLGKFSCKAEGGCKFKVQVIGDPGIEILSLFSQCVDAGDGPTSKETPQAKAKRQAMPVVTSSQKLADIGRTYFPTDIEPTEWLHVDAVVAGFRCYKEAISHPMYRPLWW
jgi:hypothetical protein